MGSHRFRDWVPGGYLRWKILDKNMEARYSWADCVDKEHLNLRWKVLRIGLPLETAHYHGIDEDPRTKFVVAHLGGKMVGCATLQTDPRDGAIYRIRGMAVDENVRNRGIGTKIVNLLQEFAATHKTGIWCNARIRAVPMYERCGFVIVSDVFEIEGIGPHHDMEWVPEG